MKKAYSLEAYWPELLSLILFAQTSKRQTPCTRVQMPLNFQLQMRDGTILRINEHEQFSQEEAVVLSYLCAQRRYYLLLGCMYAWMHQLRQALRVAFSGTQCMQDGTS